MTAANYFLFNANYGSVGGETFDRRLLERKIKMDISEPTFGQSYAMEHIGLTMTRRESFLINTELPDLPRRLAIIKQLDYLKKWYFKI